MNTPTDPSAPSPAPAAVPPAAAQVELVKLCWDEYKVLQDKIDKIGTFKFQIKGWSATLLIAGIASGKALDTAWYALLPLLILVLAFALLEGAQSQRGRQYGRRALELQNRIQRTLRHFPSPVSYSPEICQASILRAPKVRRGKSVFFTRRLLHPATANSTSIFYILMFVLGVLASVFQFISSVRSEPSPYLQPGDEVKIQVIGTPGVRGERGPAGPQGPPGPQGPKGPQGSQVTQEPQVPQELQGKEMK